MRTIPWWWRVVAGVAWCLACQAVPSAGLDLYQRIDEMHHTAWTARDGLVGRMNALVQTQDGYLWIGGSSGLYRFDGVAFERYQPIEGEFPAVAVESLLAAPGGGLWIGYSHGGVSFLAGDERAVHYTADDGLPSGRVRSIGIDGEGTMWVAAIGGLARLEGRRWRTVRSDWGYPCRSAWLLFTDRDGTLWVGAASPNRMLYLRKGARAFTDLDVKVSAAAFVQTSDRTIAFAERDAPVIQEVRSESDGSVTHRPLVKGIAYSLASDREGGFWLGGQGVTRVRLPDGGAAPADPTAAERFTREHGLSGQFGDELLIDREQNVWVLTEAGLHRFRRRNLSWRVDPRVDGLASVFTDGQGDVWAAGFTTPSLWRANDGANGASLPRSIFRGFVDPDGGTWVSTGTNFLRWHEGQFTPIAPPAEVSRLGYQYSVQAAAIDGAGRLWISVNGVGVFSRHGGRWTFVPILDGRPDRTAMRMRTGVDGRVWLAFDQEMAAVDRVGGVRVYDRRDGLELGTVLALESSVGRLWVAGERGLAYLDGQRFRSVRFAGTGVGTVRDLAATADGLWLGTSAGIVYIAEAELRRLAGDANALARFELFDLVSDLPESLKMELNYAGAAASRDGVVWFLTNAGIVRIDPRRIVRNATPPPVLVRQVVADDRSFPVRGTVALPPLTRTLRIDYTALSLTIPERVQFRYRLEGWETQWHDAGTRRSVFYTDLRPGAYVFRVTASNNDGVWNEAGAAMPFTVAPAWYQTVWFQGGVFAAGLALVAAAYQYRVRRISAALSARFDERLAERTRIARDLHDTLLQSVHGSKLVAEDALEQPDDTNRMRRAMGQVVEWLGRAVGEERAALHSLRESAESINELGDAFRRAAEDPARPPGMAVHVAVHGEPRDLHPIVRDEIYRIGCEALQNAYVHSRAAEVKVDLEYATDITLRIVDNGVGIPAEFASAGKRGRFGLLGMRERAANIAASLTVERATLGTRVLLVVPARSLLRPPRAAMPS